MQVILIMTGSVHLGDQRSDVFLGNIKAMDISDK